MLLHDLKMMVHYYPVLYNLIGKYQDIEVDII